MGPGSLRFCNSHKFPDETLCWSMKHIWNSQELNDGFTLSDFVSCYELLIELLLNFYNWHKKIKQFIQLF